MADNNFYYQLKEKLRALNPTNQHQTEDWEALQDELDRILPVQSTAKPNRWIGAVLSLSILLILSNIIWWNASQEYMHKEHANVMNVKLQETVASEDINPPNKPDPNWQASYVPIAPGEPHEVGVEDITLAKDESTYQPLADVQNKPKEQKDHFQIIKQQQLDFVPYSIEDSSADFSVKSLPEISIFDEQIKARIQATLQPLTSELKTIKKPNPIVEDISNVTNLALQENKKSSASGLLNFLIPSGLEVAVGTAVLYPLNKELEKKAGVEWGVQGVINFSQNLALIMEYSKGQLHYITNEPGAVLGNLELPPLPSSDHMHNNIDIRKQPYNQFGLGLRYSFTSTNNLHPFVGLTWINKTLEPYSLEYDLHHVTSNTTEHNSFHVTQSSNLRDLVRLGIGLDYPITSRISMTVEGFYTKQWKLTNHDALHLTGLRISGNWKF